MSSTVSVLVPRALHPAEVAFVEMLAPGLVRVYASNSAPAEDTPMSALRLVRPHGEGAVVSLSGPVSAGELLSFLGEAIAACVGGASVTGADSLDEVVRCFRDRPAPAEDGLGAWFLAYARRWVAEASDEDEDEVEVPWARRWLARTGGTVPESLLAAQPRSAAPDLDRQRYLTVDGEAGGVVVSAAEEVLFDAVHEEVLHAAQSADDVVENADFLAALEKAGASGAFLARLRALLDVEEDDGQWTELTVVPR